MIAHEKKSEKISRKKRRKRPKRWKRRVPDPKLPTLQKTEEEKRAFRGRCFGSLREREREGSESDVEGSESHIFIGERRVFIGGKSWRVGGKPHLFDQYYVVVLHADTFSIMWSLTKSCPFKKHFFLEESVSIERVFVCIPFFVVFWSLMSLITAWETGKLGDTRND